MMKNEKAWIELAEIIVDLAGVAALWTCKSEARENLITQQRIKAGSIIRTLKKGARDE
jgi:hypothetical protein